MQIIQKETTNTHQLTTADGYFVSDFLYSAFSNIKTPI